LTQPAHDAAALTAVAQLLTSRRYALIKAMIDSQPPTPHIEMEALAGILEVGTKTGS
jgi:hypothetical protein